MMDYCLGFVVISFLCVLVASKNISEFRGENNNPLRAHSLQFTLLEGQPLLN